MKYKAVIFDLFGTLVDSYDPVSYHNSLRETSSILKILPEDFIKVWEATTEKRFTGGFKTLEENLEYICKEVGVPVKPFDIRLAKMVRHDFIGILLTPRLYTVETLTEMKNCGYKLALISNCSMDIPLLWPRTVFAPLFDSLFFSSVCAVQKPDNRIFNMAVEQLEVQPEECLFVDDNSNNLTAAAALGLTSVLITDAEGREQEHSYEPREGEWNGLKVKDLPEVLDLLEE